MRESRAINPKINQAEFFNDFVMFFNFDYANNINENQCTALQA